ncbi:GNAT superfamily N-acetyltransferase [Clavibacter michiganensis]|uniref:GNAT family N-acetyltransferase n=1 Tax=Clavibacter michiganensis TaxID=28447 RepID=UPI00195ED973|nr:GNAT family N-acetyltransferase [Clavibacter michiganensis]MBM7412349.1 GNAT superfamily N-acetyltransferase [Clavibacter michiganensis]
MTAHPAPPIRAYSPADEPGWIRCRALSFLGSQYYDDVQQRRPEPAEPSVALVAEDPDGTIVGILDIGVEGALATIDTVAVDPDHQGRRIATSLLEAAVPLLAGTGATELDAWTREDPAANAWYQRVGFVEETSYLHVFVGDGDDTTGFTTPEGLGRPVLAFLHAPIEREAEMRARFRRVHVCRRYVQPLGDPLG